MSPSIPATRERLFGYAREYHDLAAEAHQQPRERIPPFTPAPYMVAVSTAAGALSEAARSRRNATCSIEPFRSYHLTAAHWWLFKAKTLNVSRNITRAAENTCTEIGRMCDAAVAGIETLSERETGA